MAQGALGEHPHGCFVVDDENGGGTDCGGWG
jgi:hypothetical protein